MKKLILLALLSLTIYSCSESLEETIFNQDIVDYQLTVTAPDPVARIVITVYSGDGERVDQFIGTTTKEVSFKISRGQYFKLNRTVEDLSYELLNNNTMITTYGVFPADALEECIEVLLE